MLYVWVCVHKKELSQCKGGKKIFLIILKSLVEFENETEKDRLAEEQHTNLFSINVM